MRPKPFSLGNTAKLAQEVLKFDRASMRPKPFSLGNAFARCRLDIHAESFNEAQAFQPGKPRGGYVNPSTGSGFNEAQAFQPGKRGATTMTTAKDQLASMRPKPFSLGNNRPEGQAKWNLLASMRPKPFSLGNRVAAHYPNSRRNCFNEAQAFQPGKQPYHRSSAASHSSLQ